MNSHYGSGLHVGLFGCGRWGRLILRDLKQLGARVSVVARSEASRTNALSYSADRIVGSIDELEESIDGCVVASVASAHAENIRALLPRRRPIYVEKPLAIDLKEAEALAAEAGELVRVMHKWRYHPGIEALSDLIRSGELGALRGLRLQRTNWGRQHPDVDCALHLLPHDLSITLHLIGYLPPIDTVIPNPVGSNRFGFVANLFDPKRDLRVALDANNLVPGNVRSFSAGFEMGVASLTDSYSDAICLYRYGQGQSPEIRPIPSEWPLQRQLRVFLDYLRGGPPPLSPIEDELRILRRVFEVREKLYDCGEDA